MQFNRCQVRDPYERGEIVSEKIVNGSLVALAPDGRGLHPVGAMLGGILFEKIFLVDSPGIALHGERPSGEMRQQIGRYADVIIDDLSLGKPGGWIEDLVKVREA